MTIRHDLTNDDDAHDLHPQHHNDLAVAVNGVVTDVAAHIADASAAHAATAISVTPFGSIAATNVQAALAEIVAEGGGGYSDEQARDAVGAALTDSATIDFTLNDGADTITAGVKTSSITTGMLAFDVATQTELSAHISDSSGAHAASAIAVTPFGSIAATDVQAALAEIVSESGAAFNPGETYQFGADLPEGCASISDPDAPVNAITMGDDLYLAMFRAPKSFPATRLRFWTRLSSNASFTLVRFALYTVSVGNDLTLVGSTVNNPNLLNAGGAYAPSTAALSVPVSVTAGTWYAAGILATGDGGSFLLASGTSSAVAGAVDTVNLHRRTALVSSPVNLPSSINSVALQPLPNLIWAEVLPA